MEEQQLWDLLRAVGRVGTATDPLGPGCPHWLLLGASVFFFLVWISTLPHRGVLSNEKWQELQVQSSQSPQGLRTPGRHWSLVALSSLLPFPLKETAAPGAQEHCKSVGEACSFRQTSACICSLQGVEFLPGTHPQGHPPSTVHKLEAVGSVFQES